jgi:integrase
MTAKPLATDVAIRKWKPAAEGEARGTGGRDGLYVRGWVSGTKAFYFRAGTWLKMGEYPELSLADARERAIVAKRLKKEGFGTDALRRAFELSTSSSDFEAIVRGDKLAGVATNSTISMPTYSQVWNDWFLDVEPTLQEGPSRRRPRAIHEHHISPVIGDRPINKIRRREVFDLLLPLFREKAVTAGHALGHINKVFERAITMELCENNPAPPRSSFPKRVTAKKPHGTLGSNSMPEFWAQVQRTKASMSVKLAILTAMVTAHRVGVIVRAEWCHIDFDSGVWTVPAREDKSTPGRMKSGRSYALKLPAGLLSELENLRHSRSIGEFVFESPTTRGHVSENAVLKVIKGCDDSLTAHGFRNAVKEFCRRAEPPVPDHIADAYCDHSLRGLDASYRRMDTSVERSELALRLFKYVVADTRASGKASLFPGA